MESTLSKDKKLCGCGCCRVMDRFNKWGYERSFIEGHSSRGERNYFWKCGRTVTPEGYVLIKAPWHPKAQSTGYVFEHILVMEAKLGRSLRAGEIVHHKNGKRDDNSESNLEFLPSQAVHMSLHMTKDMSNRICCDCNRGLAQVGRVWLKVGSDAFRCPACHMKKYRRDQSLRGA
jgi:HNH endonuclease